MTWRARLILERRDLPEVTELLLEGATLFGRTPPAEYCIPIASMSRRHLWLRVHPDGGVTIEDAGSTSGIYVEQRHIHGVVRIQPGQRIEFGGCTLRLVEVIDDRTA